LTKKKKKAAYNLPQRIYLSGHTQTEVCKMVREKLELTLSIPEYNRILHGGGGNGAKTLAVLAETDRIVSGWEAEDG
jgi:hypothetical protein